MLDGGGRGAGQLTMAGVGQSTETGPISRGPPWSTTAVIATAPSSFDTILPHASADHAWRPRHLHTAHYILSHDLISSTMSTTQSPTRSRNRVCFCPSPPQKSDGCRGRGVPVRGALSPLCLFTHPHHPPATTPHPSPLLLPCPDIYCAADHDADAGEGAEKGSGREHLFTAPASHLSSAHSPASPASRGLIHHTTLLCDMFLRLSGGWYSTLSLLPQTSDGCGRRLVTTPRLPCCPCSCTPPHTMCSLDSFRLAVRVPAHDHGGDGARSSSGHSSSCLRAGKTCASHVPYCSSDNSGCTVSIKAPSFRSHLSSMWAGSSR